MSSGLESEVVIDIIDGNSGRKTANGWEFTRIAKVKGIDNEESGYSSQSQVVQAVDLLIAEIGDIGAPHPSVETSKIVSFTPKTVSQTVVEIEIQYATSETDFSGFTPSTNNVEVGSSVQQVETNTDYEGNVISVQYTYPSDYKLDDAKKGQTIVQGGMVSYQKSNSYRIYVKSGYTDPTEDANNFVGKVNQLYWSEQPEAAARTWLCRSIVGRSSDGGHRWVTTYTFEYREETWDETAIFINPDDGKPPADLVDGVGIKTPQVQIEADFDELPL